VTLSLKEIRYLHYHWSGSLLKTTGYFAISWLTL